MAHDSQARSADPAPLRADAELNRQRIVEAARAVFAEQGLGASTNEVARRAGVGIATLFRRFPTRDDLVAAVFANRMAAYAKAVEDALAEGDAWKGFCGYIEQVCQLQAPDSAGRCRPQRPVPGHARWIGDRLCRRVLSWTRRGGP